jgi:hypothetical protein
LFILDLPFNCHFSSNVRVSLKTNAKQRLLLIRNQIIFHSKLLGSQIPNRSLLKFQEKNEKLGTEKLLANLKAIIVYNFSEGVPQNITEINDNACKVMNASRKRKTRKTDVFPVKKKDFYLEFVTLVTYYER